MQDRLANGLRFTSGASLLAQLRFSLHRSQSDVRLIPRCSSRVAGVVQVDYHPCLRQTTEAVFSLGQTGPPSPTGLGTVPANAANPGAQHLHQVSGSSSRRHPAQSLELNSLFTVPARTTGRLVSRRDTVACFGLHASLSVATSPIPGRRLLRMRQHPRVYRFSVRSRLTPSSCLTSWLSRQVQLRLPRLPFRSHGPLLLFTAPGVALGLSLFPQLRLCGVFWSTRYPCRQGL